MRRTITEATWVRHVSELGLRVACVVTRVLVAAWHSPDFMGRSTELHWIPSKLQSHSTQFLRRTYSTVLGKAVQIFCNLICWKQMSYFDRLALLLSVWEVSASNFDQRPASRMKFSVDFLSVCFGILKWNLKYIEHHSCPFNILLTFTNENQ